MITLDNLFTFFEFIAEENTYIQHQSGTTGTTNRFSRFSTETTTGQLSKLGYPRLEVVQLPFGLITDFSSSQQETLTARVRVIYKLSDKFDFDEEVTALDNAKKALFQMLNYIQTAQDECPGNSLLCAFDMNSVRYTFLDKATFSGSAVGCELSINFKKGICWEEVAYGDFPEYNGTIALPDTNGQYVLQVLNGVITWEEFSATGLVDGNGTTINGNKVDLGGTLVQDTTITRDFGSGITYTDVVSITDVGGINYDLAAKNIEDTSGRIAEFSLSNYPNTGDEIFEVAISYTDPVSNTFSGIAASNTPNYTGSKFIFSTNVNTNVNNGVAYGVESWSDREEVNFFITDNAAAHDIGKIYLHASADLTTEAWILQYIVDLSTYSGNANHGESSIYIGQNSFELRVKNQQGTYVYADQSLRSNLIITDELAFNKPAIGDVFVIDKYGDVLFGDALTDGTWKFFLDSGNFSIQKRESGSWVTKQTWT